MRRARPVILTADQRQVLQQQARARSLPARQVERARVVLRAAHGLQEKEIGSQNRFLDISSVTFETLPQAVTGLPTA